MQAVVNLRNCLPLIHYFHMQRVLLHVSFWLAYVLALTYLNVTYDVTSFELLPEGALSIFYQQLMIQLVYLVAKLPFTYAALFLLNRYLNQKSKLIGIISVLVR
jgi:hypothetical protein